LDEPVDPTLVRECIELALQAPTGSNMQSWHFVVVTDADVRAAIADLYKRAFAKYRDWPTAAGNIRTGTDAGDETQRRVMGSAEYLAQNLHRVPVHVIPCVSGRYETGGWFANASMLGSVIPAAWSLCLAARSRGLGTSWTTLHLLYEREVADVLGIPFDEVSQVALIPLGRTSGTDFKPGPRRPVDEVLHRERW
jgi:nitroreductase